MDVSVIVLCALLTILQGRAFTDQVQIKISLTSDFPLNRKISCRPCQTMQ